MQSLQVVVPNLHWRHSGVTATSRAIAPRVAALLPAAWLGPNPPAGIASLTMRDLWHLRARGEPILWHARRNNEMIAGLLLKLMGWPLKLLFTSAGQRHHTWITRFLITRMDGVIATSEASASYLKRPATVIHHGVDPNIYMPPADRSAVFAATGLPGRYGIGCFGRVRAQKGTDLFVEAMCRLLPRYPDFTAAVVGAVDEPEFARSLKERAKAAGLEERIRFLGELPVEDVPRWYQCILIYAFTSRNEGFGLTLLEAMAAGTALVAARAGAAEKVITDGQTGLLVAPGDALALAKTIEPLMQDPARAAEMGRRARERVVSEFSVDAEAARIADVYRRILSGAA